MKNTEKTIIEWLNEAKEDGYEWADAAIENCTNPFLDSGSMHRALLNAFSWSETKQGGPYWRNIYDILFQKTID